MNNIIINKYLYFDIEREKFALSDEASKIIYRQKEIICSYSGANEWCHHFVCDLLDLYSGVSLYNHSIDSYKHEDRINEIAITNKDALINWIKDSINREWSKKVYSMIINIIDDLPEPESEDV